MTTTNTRPAAGPAAAHAPAGPAASHSADARRAARLSAYHLTMESTRNLCSAVIQYGLMDLADPELRPSELDYFRSPWFDTMAEFIAPELREKILARIDAAFPAEEGSGPAPACPAPAAACDFLSQPEEVTVIVRKARRSC